jgi:hypothetical protein
LFVLFCLRGNPIQASVHAVELVVLCCERIVV